VASTQPYALHAVASFFGRTVEETFARRGHGLQIGNSEALSVPVPEGKPYIAKITWAGPTTARVVDGEGQQYVIGPDTPVALRVGDVQLGLSLVPQVRLARFGGFSWSGSLGWFVLVVAVTVFTESVTVGGTVAQPRLCALLGGTLGVANRIGLELPRTAATYAANCMEQPMAGGSLVTAEYLARLLEEDYAGEENGGIEPQEHEQSEKKADDNDFYMPAGDEGPVTKMGGAEEVSAEPVRGTEEKHAAAPEAAPDDVKKTEPLDEGAPVAPKEEEGGDAVADAAMGDSSEDTDADESSDAASEEEKGWGVRDWYDVEDEKLDAMEIKVMLSHAKGRLRIDPNDPDALQILSYYQYLAQDYDGAVATYDKFIRLFPDESAGYNNKALVYKRRGMYREEEDLYRIALSLRPDDETALNNLAVNLAHQKRYDEALAIMKQLEIIDPGDAYADLHRSKIYADMGDEEQSLAYLEKALEGMAKLDTLHHIEFRQDIRVDPSFEQMRQNPRFHAILSRYYGKDSPLRER
jgi:tetratricopeptide (TPR) repeat protein